MGNRLDAIFKRLIVDGPENVNSEFISDRIGIDNREDEFAVQFDYDNGIGVDMNLYLQVSVDGITFADATAPQNITDATGTHIWDATGTGTSYLRIKVEVISGSIDIQSVLYSAKGRH